MTIERDLYRIITGRLQFSRGDLFLCIHEPTPEQIYESYMIYDQVYDEQLSKGIPTTGEMEELLIEKGLWSPNDDREAEKYIEEVKKLKVHAFENHFKPKELRNTKRRIRFFEREANKYSSKRYQKRRETCEGYAEEERRSWLILNNTLDKHGNKFNFINSDIDEKDIIEHYINNQFTQQKIRAIAKEEPWRSMWAISTKTGSDLFGKPSTEFSPPQLSLCSNSAMYDSVYQSMEQPPEEVIMDDDCLDGWFIVQKMKADEAKKEKNKEELFKNPKIANSQEVFVMVKDQEEAKRIYDMNNERGKAVIGQRASVIDSKGRAKQGHFQDVIQDVEVKKNQMMLEQMRGRK